MYLHTYCQSAWAAITKYHEQVACKQQKYIYFSQFWRLEVQDRVLGPCGVGPCTAGWGGPFWCRWLTSHRVLMSQMGHVALCQEDPGPIYEGPTQRPHLFIQSYWELEFQYLNLQEGHIQPVIYPLWCSSFLLQTSFHGQQCYS